MEIRVVPISFVEEWSLDKCREEASEIANVSFLTNELASVHKAFDEHTKVVCEEFEVVYQ